jgi:hypothetical protein
MAILLGVKVALSRLTKTTSRYRTKKEPSDGDGRCKCCEQREHLKPIPFQVAARKRHRESRHDGRGDNRGQAYDLGKKAS